MKTTQISNDPQRKLRWSAALLLAGFFLGVFIPSLGRSVQAAALDVVINEIAWAGTDASGSDEWIELYNPTSISINLAGWSLQADDGTPSIALSGTISAGDYFLLERTDDTTISDISADLIYTGALGNDTNAETLRLLDDTATEIDTANIAGSANWPAGDNTTKASMERIGLVADSSSAWSTNNGITFNGLDASGNPLRATPKQPNSISSSSPVPLPAAVWLFGSGLLGLVGIARRKKA